MRRLKPGWVIIILLLLFDWYLFSSIKFLLGGASESVRITVYLLFWLLSLITVAALRGFPYLRSRLQVKIFLNYLITGLIGFFLGKLVAAVFFVLDDLRRAIFWLFLRLGEAGDTVAYPGRSLILTWLGLGLGGSLFLSLLYGFSNKYNYRIHRVKLKFEGLPSGFRGMKVIQISDIHSGSLKNRSKVSHGIDMLLHEKPDLVLFTGDLVNDRAVEMEGLMDVFGRIKAPMGVYSILGNHDYGDYFWGVNPMGDKALEKAENLVRLKEVHRELGWRLLMNEHVVLNRNGDEMALLGIENWGAKAGFPKYGKMAEAYRGTENYTFKILMSHDPSHWDAEVRVKYPDVDLTLSGHTHGMQFGVELPGLKWSPVQWVYNKWGGLYEAGRQKLYVNRGFGFLGYPGRVGILPEITVFEFV